MTSSGGWRFNSDYTYDIYIYSHPQTDCYVVSRLFNVARQARFPKLGSKPGWLKRQSEILPLSHEETSASEGNFNAYITFVLFYIYPLNGYRELNSFEEPCFTLVATITSLTRELNPTGVGEHIYIYIYMKIIEKSSVLMGWSQDNRLGRTLEIKIS